MPAGEVCGIAVAQTPGPYGKKCAGAGIPCPEVFGSVRKEMFRSSDSLSRIPRLKHCTYRLHQHERGVESHCSIDLSNTCQLERFVASLSCQRRVHMERSVPEQ